MGSGWYDLSQKKLEAADYLDMVMLSFLDEPEYNEFNKRHRGQYTIIHTLNNPTSGRFHVWVEKNKSATWVTNHNKGQRSHSVKVEKI
ncbi:hypothetical protein LCGC14_2927150 [marine sediment metagenome]|uniref:Uncharacterized protein n=1 Tax=marine sediment metagenome TaxID=412755 RepID=A0A0F8XMB8_9ZZZZ